MAQKNKCWIITEGLIGTENQCIGVAEALNIDFEVKRVSLQQPWKSLSPYFGFEQSWSFEPKLEGPWPELIIAAGRKAIAAARYIKKKNPETYVTFLQDPRSKSHNFDLIAVPKHDPLRGHNVLVTQASPNRINETHLKVARDAFPDFRKLPSPRIAVLIGGSSQAYNMSKTNTTDLIKKLEQIDGSLMITCSRRTGIENERLLRDALDHEPNFFWNGNGENPYIAMLSWADYILVTADSASMISDACTTGKPVFMIDLEGGGKRINSLHENLINAGILKRFTGSIEHYTYEPLNDAELVAKEIQKCIQKF